MKRSTLRKSLYKNPRRAITGALLILGSAICAAAAFEDEAVELQPLEPAAALDMSAEGGDETPAVWFVELQSAPTADGTSLNTVRAEKAAFRNNAKKAGVSFQERYAFDTLFNGISVRAGRAQAAALGRLAGVKAVYPSVIFTTQQQQTDSNDPAMGTAIKMTGADVARNSLGLTGAGVKVAIIDSGIDLDHADLGGDGVAGFPHPNSRVIAGYDFVGDNFDSNPANPTYQPVPNPDAIPDDCGGHGTHVAGIAGANGAVQGVAPGVTFGAYRVFGCGGSSDADIIVAAMERALADGMHIVNMSLGAAFQWPQYPTAQASDRLVNKGVVVVAAMGNSGGNGLYSGGAPGVGKKVIGVASVDNSHTRLRQFTISPDATPIGYTGATGAPAAPMSGTFDMARTGTSTSAADACTALPAGSLTGKVALIRRGTCGFHVKAANAQAAGAAGVVLYNNVAGRINPSVTGTPTITIPVVAVSDTEGVLINNRLAAGSVQMTWTSEFGSFPSPTGGLIASSSSYGMAPDLSLKPNISAPGGGIYSTYPIEQGSYVTIGGTSMASPHVAGAAALLLQAAPKTNSHAVMAIFQNSADPFAWWGNPGLGLADNVHRQGAGLIDIDDAILAKVSVTPSGLSLGESQAGPSTQTLTVTNKGNSDVTYNVTHAPALATGPNAYVPAFFAGYAQTTFSAPTVTVPAGGSATVLATIAAPGSALADKSMYGGYIVFTEQGPVTNPQVLRVPYAGLKGDYQTIQVLTPTANGFPWLAKLGGTTYTKQTDGATYTLSSGDLPYVLAHFDHQSRLVRLEAINTTTGVNWGRVDNVPYLGKNGTATGFFSFVWDGVTTNGSGKTFTVPNGQYVIRITVTKALGDSANPADVETWTSPTFNIARP